MKKCFAMLFCLLFLCGCAKGNADSETTVTGVTTVFATEMEEIPATTSAALAGFPEDDEFVRVSDHIPGLVVDLKYSTTQNFTGQTIYGFSDAYLRYGTVQKLAAVQSELSQMGLSLKIWDAFRPPQAQFLLWEICPDGNYVSDPHKGFSSHSRGNTVDVTLVDEFGQELEMPTGFDDFSSKADRNYDDCTEVARKNAQLLEDLMVKHGFKPYSKEWWHFSDSETYEPDENFIPRDGEGWYAKCEEFISLRATPSTSADVIVKIPAGEHVSVIGWIGNFAHVQYGELDGYVLTKYLELESQGGA